MSSMHEVVEQEQKVSYNSTLLLRLPGDWSDEDFFDFCQMNPEFRIERNAIKEILIMAPTSSETGRKNFEIVAELAIWNRKHQLGIGFDSSAGFKLANGAERSPDIAWIRNERWEALTPEQQDRFAPIAPDFILELRSKDQNLVALKAKMEEYIACGCRMGWLVDAQGRKTFVYTENGDIQTVSFEEILSGGEVLPGFELRLADLFKAA